MKIKTIIQMIFLFCLLYYWIGFGIKLQGKSLKYDTVEEITEEITEDITEDIKEDLTKCNTEKNGYSDYQIIAWYLKSKESFHPKAYWDVKQYTNGWGTLSKKNEVISLKTANKRFLKDFNRRYKNVSREYSHLNKWDKYVLTSLTYNVGNIGPNLNEAIVKYNVKKIKHYIKQYHYAGGKKNKGLIIRRNEESNMFGMKRKERIKLGERLRKIVIQKSKI